MSQPPRHRIVRARQRSRSYLHSFAVPLTPSPQEVGIDRVKLTVRGTWECHPRGACDYLGTVGTFHPTLDWFRNTLNIRRSSGHTNIAAVARDGCH